jgi:hypothetical protein
MTAFEAWSIVLGGGLIVGLVGLFLTRYVKHNQ